jgi:hypothetical protein
MIREPYAAQRNGSGSKFLQKFECLCLSVQQLASAGRNDIAAG